MAPRFVSQPDNGYYNPITGLPSWDQQLLASMFNTMTLNQPHNNEWYFNLG